MQKKKEKSSVKVEVTFTEGYEKRFTAAILKLFETRERKKQEENTKAG